MPTTLSIGNHQASASPTALVSASRARPNNPAIELLEHFGVGDAEFFRALDLELDVAFQQVSRTFPPGYYEELRQGVLASFMSVIGGGRLRVSLVVDTNIILGDAFRVGRGKSSSTERLLASPFVRLVSPTEISAEARKHVVADIPKDASLAAAQAQLEKLLARLTIVPATSVPALDRARELLADRDPSDVPFLAVLIDTEGEGIVSRDRAAFESLDGVHRWELGELADLVTTYESGALAIAVSTSTLELLNQVASTVLTLVLRAIHDTFAIFAGIIVGLATGAAEALAKVPAWAWTVLGVVGGAIAIAAILDEGFRDWLLEGLSGIGQILVKAAKTIVSAVKAVITAVHDLLSWLWEVLEPALLAAGKGALVCAGVLYRRVLLLIDECNRAIA